MGHWSRVHQTARNYKVLYILKHERKNVFPQDGSDLYSEDALGESRPKRRLLLSQLFVNIFVVFSEYRQANTEVVA